MVIESFKLSSFKLLYCFFQTLFFIQNVYLMEIEFGRILINTTYVEGHFNASLMTIGRYNRTTHVLNSKVEMFRDYDEQDAMEINFNYNQNGNSDYIKSHINFKKDTLCNIIEKYYKRFVMSDMKEYSNLPQYTETDKVCPIPKVNF